MAFSIGNLGAGLSAMYPGVIQGRQGEAAALLSEMQAQQAQETQQADVVRGNALMELFNGGGSPSMPTPMPGQPSTPTPPAGGGMAPQPGPDVPRPPGLIPQPYQPANGPRPSPAPAYPLGPQPNDPVTAGGPTSPPAAPPQAPQPQRQAPATPPGAGGGGNEEPSLNGVGEQGGRPTIHGGVPNGPLTWQAIGQAIARANPGAPPQLVAKAIDKFAPMMTVDSQMQWRILKMQHEKDMLGTREDNKNLRAGGREAGLNTRQGFMLDMRNKELAGKNERNEVSNETRMAAAGLSADTRSLIAQAHEEGANSRLMTTLRARDDWKKLDVDSKREITDMIIEGQREREATRQTGANERSAATIAGANQRNQNTVEGAAARNQNTTATALEVARQRTDLAKWLADGKPLTATQSRVAEKTQTYDSAISTIDDAMNAVRQGHVEGKDVVGLKGRIRGLAEIGSNISGWSRDGKPDETRRAEFVQKIELLRATLPRLLTQSAISNKDERSRMMNILQGLERGSTKQATFADLMYLKEKLGQLKPALGANTNQGDIRATRPGAGPAAAEPPTGGAGLKPMTPALQDAMDKAVAAGQPRADVEKYIRDTYGVDPAAPAAPGAQKVTGGSMYEDEEFDKFMEKMAEISSKVNAKAFNAWLKTAPTGDVEDRREKKIRPRATFREPQLDG